MKRLKDISKKQWGVVSTSIGSLLIIVGLLAMVGIGGTYAADTSTMCTCPSGYTQSGNKCEKSGTKTDYCCTGLSCKIVTGYEACTSTAGCNIVNTQEHGTGSTKYTIYTYGCTKTEIIDTKTCSCESGTPNSSGLCDSDAIACNKGEYQTGSSYTSYSCKTCDAGFYCPDGVNKYPCKAGTYSTGGVSSCTACPSNATCTTSTFTCDSGYHKNGSICVKNSGISCPAGSYYLDSSKNCTKCEAGYYCPGGTADMSLLQDQLIISCPANATCGAGVSTFTCNSGYTQSGNTCVKKDSGGSGNPGGDSGNSGGNSGNSGGNSGNSGGNSGNSGGNSGNPGGNSGNPGGNSGNPGGNSGNPGGNSGNSSGGLGNADGGNNSNVNNNPSTATKAPLIIALMGVMSLAFGVFTYWKNRKVTDM